MWLRYQERLQCLKLCFAWLRHDFLFRELLSDSCSELQLAKSQLMFSVSFNDIDLFHSNGIGSLKFTIFHLFPCILCVFFIASGNQVAKNNKALQGTENPYWVVRSLRVIVCGRFWKMMISSSSTSHADARRRQISDNVIYLHKKVQILLLPSLSLCPIRRKLLIPFSQNPTSRCFMNEFVTLIRADYKVRAWKVHWKLFKHTYSTKVRSQLFGIVGKILWEVIGYSFDIQ